MTVYKSKILLAIALALFNANIFADFDEKQKQEIGTVVHDYLVANPEVVAEAIQALQVKENKIWLDNAKTAIKENIQDIFNSNSPKLGGKDAKISVVEFFDYNCPHCKTMSPLIENLLKNKDIQIIYKELPVLGESSLYAAKAALAARDQNKFKEFHEKLMAYPRVLTNDKILELAKETGLNVEKLKKDMDSPEVTQELQNNQKVAVALGMRGTPTFILGRNPATKEMPVGFIPGETSQEELTKQIDSLR
ncbi:MAG: DsbA family protein [Candidatus Berkiellales bacterium]